MNGTLRNRLRGLCLDVPADVAARHMAAVADELRTTPAPTPSPGGIWWRRRVVALSTLVAVAAPVSAAVAAESAMPGDALYPVKRATEWVRSWIDDGVAADHRLDELENALEQREPLPIVEDRLRDAEAAVGDTPPDTDRATRLDAARDRISRDYPTDPSLPEPTDRPPAVTPSTTRPPADRPTTTGAPGDTTTTTAVTDETTEPPPTRTKPPRTDTRPPPDEPPPDRPGGDDDRPRV